MKIWCLFGVENNYDQPPHNLVAWWKEKPSFEVLMSALGGSMAKDSHVVICANVFQGQEDVRFDNTDFTLSQVAEGRLEDE